MPITAITGSASGIGAATSASLKAAGHEVIGIDLANADINADLSTAEGRENAIAAILERCNGHLDGLVCCAGVGVTAPSNSIIVGVNYFGAAQLVDGLSEALANSENAAATIIGSVSASISPDALSHEITKVLLNGDEAAAKAAAESNNAPHLSYACSKYAVTQFARSKVIEWGRKGMRINVVAPGAVETPLHHAALKDPKYGESVKNFVAPLGRAGSTEEMAEAISFLQSDKASFIHGSVLFVDGGMDAMVRPGQF